MAKKKKAAKRERKAPVGTITGVPCMKKDWQTPEHLLAGPRAYWGGQIPFDPATSKDNPTRALQYCAKGKVHKLGARGGEWVSRDGLSVSWGRAAFCNPPYGRDIAAWLEKMGQEARAGCEIIALLPCARWEQDYFTGPLKEANAVCFIRGRVAFRNPDTGDNVNGNPYANMFIGFGVTLWRFREAFEPLAGSEAMMRRGFRSACFGIGAA